MNLQEILRSAAVILIISLAAFVSASACDIEFEIIKNKKSEYKVGDKLIAKVSVLLTHRNCPEGIEATDFKTDGISIDKATKWSKVSTDLYERKLLLTVTGSKNGKAFVSASRTCDKEGGFGILSLNVK